MHQKIDQFSSFLDKELNQAQRDAVMLTEGPLLIIAGAGSGKTRVITARIAYLMTHKQVSPIAITALTFTNKAAQEMQSRITNFLGDIPIKPFIGTFHSFCVRFLKAHAEFLQKPFASILDEDDQHKILSGIIKRHALAKKVTAKQLAWQISRIKNMAHDHNDGAAHHQDQFFREIYQAYEQEKLASKAFDFDDLMIETVALLRKNKIVQKTFQASSQHVLIDEYQDTNSIQRELLMLLAMDSENKLSARSICAVGDEDQSIYSWRGATVTNMLNFRTDFPDTTVIKIEQNYRSVQPILDIANQLITHNTQRSAKKLWSSREAINRAWLLSCSSEYQEADAIAAYAKMSLRVAPQATIAILYRAHYQSRAIEEALIKRAVPYTIMSGIQFYERKEIKDLLSYLRLIANPFDRPSFFRVINCPLRGLGEAFEEMFYDQWHNSPFTDWTVVAQAILEKHLLPPKKEAALQSFMDALQGFSVTDKPSAVLNTLITRISYLTYLRETFDKEDAENKIENIKELLHAINHFESIHIDTVELFLHEVALLQEKIMLAKRDDSNGVMLMTLHAAKGLEFDHVAIAGINEDILPSTRASQDPDAVEEERRLFYVGVTRARERLLLSYGRNRHMYGQLTEYMPSRFIRECSEGPIIRHDVSYVHPEQLDRMFTDWCSAHTKTERRPMLTFGAAIVQNPEDDSEIEEALPAWHKHQRVTHDQFGNGTIDDIERKKDGSIYVTVRFGRGTKKISAAFIRAA